LNNKIYLAGGSGGVMGAPGGTSPGGGQMPGSSHGGFNLNDTTHRPTLPGGGSVGGNKIVVEVFSID